MKKYLLNSLLLVPLSITSLTTVVSCTKKDEAPIDTPSEQPIQQPENEKDEPLKTEYTSIKFKVKEGQEGVTFIGSTYAKARVGRPFATVVQPIAMKDGFQHTYWVDEGGNEIPNNYIIPKTGLIVYPYFESDVDLGKCTGIAAIQTSNISLINHGNNKPNVQFSRDGIVWESYVAGSSIEIEAGSSCYFKGSNTTFSQSETDYTSFLISGAVNINGSVTTLLDGGLGTQTDLTHDYCFYRLFESCSGIVSISSNFIPKGKLTKYCYAYMFSDCSCLTDFPSTLLPNEELSKTTGPVEDRFDGTLCYACMFMNCVGLKTLPEDLLPATTLSTYCYYGMFQGCTGLESIPAMLPATALTYGCYYSMFSGCTNLKTIDAGLLPSQSEGTWSSTSHLANKCYANMFSICTSLEAVPSNLLPATDLSYGAGGDEDDSCAYCYNQMFYGCTSLTSIPELPAMTLAKGCYESMFYNCESLALLDSDYLPATTLQTACYKNMFYNCKALTGIPNLLAGNEEGTMAPECYAYMFHGCDGFTNLGSSTLPGKVAFKQCYDHMFAECENLVTPAPIELTTLAPYCCNSMFYSCDALQSSPALGATAAAEHCYSSMFSDCKSLSAMGTIGITDWTNGSYACSMMFSECEALDIWYTASRGDPPVAGTLILTLPETYDETKHICENMFQGTINYQDQGWSPFNGEGNYQRNWYLY